jgi:hypothetical protein
MSGHEKLSVHHAIEIMEKTDLCLVELRGFEPLTSAQASGRVDAPAYGSGRPTTENAPLDPTLAAVERAVTLSQRFLLAAPERKVVRQADWTWLESERHPESARF